MKFDTLMQLLRALADAQVDSAFTGSFAREFSGMRGLTEDLDVVVTDEPANLHRLQTALHAIRPALADDVRRRLQDERALRIVWPEEKMAVDFFATDEPLVYETVLLHSVPVRIATAISPAVAAAIAAKRSFRPDVRDTDILARIRDLNETAARIVPPTPKPRGVRKYRSIEAMSADHDRWQEKRVTQFRTRSQS
jgi:hypothetical protein